MLEWIPKDYKQTSEWNKEDNTKYGWEVQVNIQKPWKKIKLKFWKQKNPTTQMKISVESLLNR
jgi:hypothetical protein